MAEGAAVGALAVKIGADANQLISELGRADKALGKHGESYAAASKLAAGFVTAAVLAATAIAVATKAALTNADAVHKAAQAAGMATQAFSEYAYSAGLSGISTEQLSTSLSKLNRGIVDAANFTGGASRAFQALGINVRNSDGSLKSVDQIMNEVADKFSQMEDGVGKSALAIEMFGRAGAQMIPMLNQGSRGLKEMREEAKLLGATIDSETGKAAEQFNDNLTRLATVSRGYANQLMKELLPALNGITDAMVRSKKESGGYHDEIKSLATFLQDTGLASFQVLGVSFANLSFMAKTLGDRLGGIGASLAMLASGDFKGFKAIDEAMKESSQKARAELDALEKKIMGVQLAKPVAAGGAMDLDDDPFGIRKKKPAPEIQDEKEGGVSKQIQEGIDEENKMQMEAIAATVAFRDRELAIDKETYDNRNKALIDFYDLEQEMAIAQGQILLDGEGSHSEKFIELRRSLLTEASALENEAYAKSIEKLDGFSDEELAAVGGKQAVLERMEQEHQDRIDRIKKEEFARSGRYRELDFDSAKSFFGSMSALMNTKSKEMFAIGKAAAIAETIVNTSSAAMGAYKAMSSIPYVGPALGAAAALAAVAAGAAQIQKIRSTSVGGGGGAVGTFPASPTTGLPVAAQAPAAERARGPDTFITLNGETFGRKQLRDLLKQISEEGRDGGRVVLAN